MDILEKNSKSKYYYENNNIHYNNLYNNDNFITIATITKSIKHLFFIFWIS